MPRRSTYMTPLKMYVRSTVGLGHISQQVFSILISYDVPKHLDVSRKKGAAVRVTPHVVSLVTLNTWDDVYVFTRADFTTLTGSTRALHAGPRAHHEGDPGAGGAGGAMGVAELK